MILAQYTNQTRVMWRVEWSVGGDCTINSHAISNNQIIDTFMERLEIALTRLSIDLTPLESGQHAFKSIYRNKRGGA